jgi:hypothetical protein
MQNKITDINYWLDENDNDTSNLRIVVPHQLHPYLTDTEEEQREDVHATLRMDEVDNYCCNPYRRHSGVAVATLAKSVQKTILDRKYDKDSLVDAIMDYYDAVINDGTIPHNPVIARSSSLMDKGWQLSSGLHEWDEVAMDLQEGCGATYDPEGDDGDSDLREMADALADFAIEQMAERGEED